MVFPSTPEGFLHKFWCSCMVVFTWCLLEFFVSDRDMSVIKTQKSQDPMNYVLSGNLAAALKSTIMM